MILMMILMRMILMMTMMVVTMQSKHIENRVIRGRSSRSWSWWWWWWLFWWWWWWSWSWWWLWLLLFWQWWCYDDVFGSGFKCFWWLSWYWAFFGVVFWHNFGDNTEKMITMTLPQNSPSSFVRGSRCQACLRKRRGMLFKRKTHFHSLWISSLLLLSYYIEGCAHPLLSPTRYQGNSLKSTLLIHLSKHKLTEPL